MVFPFGALAPDGRESGHQWFLKNAERYDNIRILKTKLENAIFDKLAEAFVINPVSNE